MGLWIVKNLNANYGDCKCVFWLGPTVNVPFSNVQIPLYSLWLKVSYSSNNERRLTEYRSWHTKLINWSAWWIQMMVNFMRLFGYSTPFKIYHTCNQSINLGSLFAIIVKWRNWWKQWNSADFCTRQPIQRQVLFVAGQANCRSCMASKFKCNWLSSFHLYSRESLLTWSPVFR